MWRHLRAYDKFERMPSTRNNLIHSREIGQCPVALEDISQMSVEDVDHLSFRKLKRNELTKSDFVRFLAILKQAYGSSTSGFDDAPHNADDEATLAGLCLIRALDFCGEHYYLLSDQVQAQFDNTPEIQKLFQALGGFLVAMVALVALVAEIWPGR